jgi:hypothetical protein
MPVIYILSLESNKYYVGKTSRPINDRFLEHITDHGSEWTKKYKPISILETIENASDFDEDKYVKIYMQKYGIYNVRGGSYSRIYLSSDDLIVLKKEIQGAENRCYRCGRVGHFIKNCYAKTKEDGEKLEEKIIEKKENYITNYTVNGKDLSDKFLKDFSLFLPDEEILFIWNIACNFKFLDESSYVGLTKNFIFKIEKGSIFMVDKTGIKSVEHKKNGFFTTEGSAAIGSRWDKIGLNLNDGTEETIGIYHSDTTEYFVNYMNSVWLKE